MAELTSIAGAPVLWQVGSLALVQAGAAQNGDCVWVYDSAPAEDPSVPMPIAFLVPTEMRALAATLLEVAGAE